MHTVVMGNILILLVAWGVRDTQCGVGYAYGQSLGHHVMWIINFFPFTKWIGAFLLDNAFFCVYIIFRWTTCWILPFYSVEHQIALRILRVGVKAKVALIVMELMFLEKIRSGMTVLRRLVMLYAIVSLSSHIFAFYQIHSINLSLLGWLLWDITQQETRRDNFVGSYW